MFVAMRQCVFFLALAGCGGAIDTDLFAGGGVDSGTTPGTDATVQEDSGTTEQDAGTVKDTGTIEDTGPRDTGRPDTGTSLSDGIQCGRGDAGTPACSPGIQSCCITTPPGGGRSFECRSTITPVACLGTDLSCDDRADCVDQGKQNQVCCGKLDNSRVAGASCQPTCTGDGVIILCDPREASPCPPGRTCRVSQGTLQDYYLCLQ
jgi:hypothetical protein